MINAYLNARNRLVKVYVMKDLFGILVVVSVNAINHVMLENMQTMKIVRAEKNWLINELKNVLKMLKK